MKKFVLGLLILLCLSSIASAQNILLNSSYELWRDSLGVRMPFGWYTSEVRDSGSAIRVTDPHSGIYALQLNGSDSLAYATTLSICFAGRNYYFSGWCKSNSVMAGTFIITWLKLSQQPVMDPVIIPINRSTSYRHYTQMVQAPDSAIIVNVTILTLPSTLITVDDVTFTDTVLTGIEENEITRVRNGQHNDFVVYPNPCNNQTQILFQGKQNQSFKLDIYDISGKLIKTINQTGAERITLDTKQLTEGIYFLKDKTTIRKLIVQR